MASHYWARILVNLSVTPESIHQLAWTLRQDRAAVGRLSLLGVGPRTKKPKLTAAREAGARLLFPEFGYPMAPYHRFLVDYVVRHLGEQNCVSMETDDDTIDVVHPR